MDLAFAIDDLYSTGWWPDAGGGCVRAIDGRWFPDGQSVRDAFSHAGQRFELLPSPSGSVSRASWTDGFCGTHTVIAEDDLAAGVLALAELRRLRRTRPDRSPA